MKAKKAGDRQPPANREILRWEQESVYKQVVNWLSVASSSRASLFPSEVRTDRISRRGTAHVDDSRVEGK